MAEPEPGTPRDRLRAWLDVAASYFPSMSFDGESVLFLSDAGELPQAFRVSAGGGSATPISPAGRRVGAIDASPVGPSALVSIDTGGDEHWQLGLLHGIDAAKPALRALTNSPKVIHSAGAWRPDGSEYLFASNARDRRFFDIHSVEVGRPDPVPKELYRGDGLHEVIAADAHRVLIGRFNTNLDVDLLLLEGDRAVHLNPHAGEETIFSADLTRDAVFAGANPARELAALVRYRPGRPGHEFLREYPGDVDIVRAAPDGSTVLLGVNRDGWTELHLYEPSTGTDRPFPTSPKGVVTKVAWAPDGTAFAHDLSSVNGVEVYRRSIETGKPRRLTTSAHPPPTLLNPPKLGKFGASDRVTVPYWEFEPTGPARGLLIEVHGGPEAQARPGLNRFRQFLVAEGWRVVVPNVRGSTGYGRTYVHLDDVRKRMDSVRDLRDLVEHLVATRRAERGRIGILGGSYGGFMVLAALATYPELFGAGVDIVGIANFVTFLEETGPWRRAVREAEYGSLANDRDFLESISPIRHADRIVAPLLVIHGRNDPRVPAREAEQIVATLRSHARTVELMMFEDEGHGIVGRTNRETAYGRTAEFLAEQLTGLPNGSA
jgi:dipeptidyl aminopeptidase/acylaminoacyl peptidase